MIVRSKRTQNFTIIPNMLLEDKSIDWKELGLLVYLLSKPDEWSVSVQHLAKQRKAGRDAILKSLKLLRDAGYVTMQRQHEGGVEYTVYDTPQNRKKPLTENPEVANENPDPKPEKPLTDYPTMGKATNGLSGHIVNTDKTTKTEKDKQIAFDDFYSAYPKKVKRKDAERKWKTLSPENQQAAIDGISNFITNKPKQFICAPDVYLNGERWLDEPEEASNATHFKPDKQSQYLDELAKIG